MLGLVAYVDEDLRELPWIPRFLRKRPFFIGLFNLHVPIATAVAVRGAPEQHKAEQLAQDRNKVLSTALQTCMSVLHLGPRHSADLR